MAPLCYQDLQSGRNDALYFQDIILFTIRMMKKDMPLRIRSALFPRYQYEMGVRKYHSAFVHRNARMPVIADG